jgi:hypothetical protein
MVTLEGKQLEGDFNAEQVRDLMGKNRGKPILVWAQGMAQWADPSTIAELRPAAPPTPSAAPPPAFAAISRKDVKAQVGFLKGLLDFGFQSFITTRMIPVLYAVVMALIALGAVGYILIVGGGSIITGIRLESATLILTGLISMILVPIVAIIYLAFIRMWFEVVIVFFRMKENLDELVKGSGKGGRETP